MGAIWCMHNCMMLGVGCMFPSWHAQGDGVPPSEAREFCDWLGGASAPRLPGLAFSVCALGDT